MTNSIGTVTIHKASEMTKDGQKLVAQWLREQAKLLETEGDNLSDRFTARYMKR